MLHIRSMTLDDLALGMRLKAQAGWNQTEADWRRQLALEPEGCFVAEWDGVPRGTTCACMFGPVAWLATVLVDAQVRRRGIGTALVERALDWLDRRGVPTVRLDATSLGRPLYEKLGFVAQFELTRFEGVPQVGCVKRTNAREGPDTSKGMTSLQVVGAFHAPYARSSEQTAELLHLDRQVTRTDRSKLLERLFAEQPEAVGVVRDSGRLLGFIAQRPGANAVQIGPCIAESGAGPLLVADALRRCAGRRVYLDIPVANTAGADLAQSHGLTVQRQFVRMCRGQPVQEDLGRLWASFGPEKG